MLSTSNISIQFGAKPLFEGVTVKFTDSNRYGLIGANGCGKSTLMKILGGDLEQSSGEVMLQAGMRLGKLSQNQFGYEDERVIDTVMQGLSLGKIIDALVNDDQAKKLAMLDENAAA